MLYQIHYTPKQRTVEYKEFASKKEAEEYALSVGHNTSVIATEPVYPGDLLGFQDGRRFILVKLNKDYSLMTCEGKILLPCVIKAKPGIERDYVTLREIQEVYGFVVSKLNKNIEELLS